MNIRGFNGILLRAIEKKDLDLLQEIINDPETEEMLGGWSLPVSIEMQNQWFEKIQDEKDVFRCAIEINSKTIGTIILNKIDQKNGTAEIHIKISSKERGKGFGKNALNALTDYAFSELRLKCIYAHIIEYNKPSLMLFQSCGFEKDGMLRSRIFKKGKYCNLVALSKLNNLI